MPWTHPRLSIWLGAVAVVLFAVSYLRPVTEGDYFWHVHTGQWIVENGKLPAADPFKFTYTSLDPSSQEYTFTTRALRGNWLADVALYGLDRVAGLPGVILLRFVVYAGILAWIVRRMSFENAGPLGIAAMVAVAVLLGEYPNERPQIFSFLFFSILFFLLEGMERAEGKNLARRGAATIFLMALWANVHGAFLLGIVVLLLYAVGRFVEGALRGCKPRAGELLLVCGAIGATLLNPNGWGLLFDFTRHFGGAGWAIHEYVSPISAWRDNGEYYLSYWFFLALTALIVILRFKRMKPWHLLTLSALMVLSLTAMRHMALLLLAAPILAPYLGGFIPWSRVGAAAAVGVIALGLATVTKADLFQMREDRHFPKEATEFFLDNPTESNLYNFYDWGAYLSMRMPDRLVFMDGCNTYKKVSDDHDMILAGQDWAGTLAAYGVNTVVIPGVSQHTGRVYPLILELAAAPGWALVYWDDTALIFLRDTGANRDIVARWKKPSVDVNRHILARAAWLERRIGRCKELWLGTGGAHARLGQWNEAAEDFRRALALDPADASARIGLDIAEKRAGRGG